MTYARSQLVGAAMTLASSAAVGEQLAFGEFELAPAARALWRSGVRVSLPSRALDILVALVSRPGETLSKEELTRIVWRGAVVDETLVRVAISAARKALGENGKQYLVTVPGRGYCFAAGVAQTTSRLSTRGMERAPLRPQRLPLQIARVVGREAVVEALAQEVKHRRLLSLVGPGGIGKTTVALAIAERLKGEFDAIAFIDLAMEDGAQMSAGVAAALGLSLRPQQDPIDGIAAAVEGTRVLLLLDNCEHVVDLAAGFAEDLLGRAPGVTILATTRELLRAAGEWVHHLSALQLPPIASPLSAQEARGYSAVAMFEDRACHALGGYQLDDADAPYVAEICHRLDGIALAIELAAGRLPSLGVRGLAASLEDSFRILTPGRRKALPRHQTLSATFDWSYQLLSAEDQAALRRLSVFRGAFTLEDAAAVIESEHLADAADCLATLVDKSLVIARPSSWKLPYILLETSRAYAQQKLAEAGEADSYRRRHAEHTRAAFDTAQAEWGGQPVRNWLQAYSGQLGNLRAALDWAFSPDGDGAIGAAMTAAAAPLWFHLSLLDEGMARVEQAIAWTKRQPRPDRRLMLQLHAASTWPRVQAIGGTPDAAAARQEALALAVQLEDIDYQLQAVWALLIECANRGAAAEALAMADRFAALAKQASDPQDQVIARRLRGKSLHFLGDFAGSRREAEKMLELYEPRPSHLVRFQYDQQLTAQITLARDLWLLGYADRALALVEQMVDKAQALGQTLTLGAVVCDAACFIALWVGDMALAARYTDMLRANTSPAYRGWHSLADGFEGEILIRQGRAEEGVERLEHAIQSLKSGPFCIYLTAFEGVLAEGLLARGQIGDALETVDGAIGRCRASGEAWCLAELTRIRAMALAGAGRPMEAVAALADGFEIAVGQGALAWELRLASTLAEIEDSVGARGTLGGVVDRVTEGFGTNDYLRSAAMLGR
jgi:predicted ATPase/DNA-binding winged helix-turn-helix (wHTH) protein